MHFFDHMSMADVASHSVTEVPPKLIRIMLCRRAMLSEHLRRVLSSFISENNLSTQRLK